MQTNPKLAKAACPRAVIHKAVMCPLCHCGQTLPVDLQTCECACHYFDRAGSQEEAPKATCPTCGHAAHDNGQCATVHIGEGGTTFRCKCKGSQEEAAEPRARRLLIRAVPAGTKCEPGSQFYRSWAKDDIEVDGRGKWLIHLEEAPDDPCPVSHEDCNRWASEFEKASKFLTGRGQLREYYQASAAKLRELSGWIERGRV